MMSSQTEHIQTLPLQHQNRRPGLESDMIPRPISVDRKYKGSEKLLGRTAIITGGDSGIGRAVAVYYTAEQRSCTRSNLDAAHSFNFR
ncbi:hypothetical protein QFZ78_007278 [Paenibacillus sp. V4I5]|nr:hypothetical protein [Paenibacillus sp. V4I5]